MDPKVLMLVDEATAVAKQKGHGSVEPAHLWAALQRVDPGLAGSFREPAPAIDEQLRGLAQSWDTPTISDAVEGLLERVEASRGGIAEMAEGLAALVKAEPRPDGATGAPHPSHAPATPVPRATSPIDPAELRAALTQSLLGQDEAVEAVVRRLALTRRSFDLRPERPDGVFFFAGPTGVGKTFLAELLANELYGEGSLIRLDMSEYSDASAVSRLVGPQPGYVGYDNPDSWLTTRMIKEQSAVVLLDEVEKSHPTVWNTFLQLFDSGRLTDSRGKTADFSSTIVVLTSNLGSNEMSGRPGLGFSGSTASNTGNEAAVRAEIERVLPIELVNRLDDVVVFNALGEEQVEGIARQALRQALDRISGTYDVDVDAALVGGVVKTLHDPRFGARQVHRIIEERLLAPLVLEPPGSYRGEFDGEDCRWTAIEGSSAGPGSASAANGP